MQLNTTLETVADYVDDARVLLLDQVQPYRYDDTSLLTALNVALLEGRRLRADLFVFNDRKGGHGAGLYRGRHNVSSY
jgi:hypothetical protein